MLSAGKGAMLCQTNLYGISMGSSLRQTNGLRMCNWKCRRLIEGVVRLICNEEIVDCRNLA